MPKSLRRISNITNFFSSLLFSHFNWTCNTYMTILHRGMASNKINEYMILLDGNSTYEYNIFEVYCLAL